jgi:O-antigen ligase
MSDRISQGFHRAPPALWWPIFGGTLIAATVTLLLFNAPPVWTVLTVAALLAVLPTFVFRDPEQYWLAMFLFCLAFEIKKMLLDGKQVIASLGLESLTTVLVPEVRLHDLPLAVLLCIWIVRIVRGEARIYLPRSMLLISGYFVWGTLSSIAAPHPYLGGVMLFRDFKTLILFLYVVNNIDLKRWLKVMMMVLMSLLVLQGALTLVRYQFRFFGFVGGSALGRVDVDTEKSRDLLVQAESGSVSRTSGARRGFGTLPAPASTSKLLLLLLPVSSMLFLRTSSWLIKWGCLVSFMLGTVALVVTFSRAGLVALAGQMAVTLWFAYKLRYISRHACILIVVAVGATALLCSPLAYVYLTTRPSSVSIRATQYEGALRMIASNPVLGVGLNNSTVVMKHYVPGTSGPTRDPTKQAYQHPVHSYFLSVWAEIGIVGLVCYLGFFVAIARLGLRRLNSRDPDTALVCSAFLLGLLGVGLQVLGDPLNEAGIFALIWFYAGAIAGLSKIEESSIK